MLAKSASSSRCTIFDSLEGRREDAGCTEPRPKRLIARVDDSGLRVIHLPLPPNHPCCVKTAVMWNSLWHFICRTHAAARVSRDGSAVLYHACPHV